ncbi:MAG: hypothetical protein HXY28_03140 [Hydrogenophilaceae bacterium]|jgi:hypothetical protein|nr:hypothetical protein [Hydrogenophilaceae bacterium]
MSVIKEDLAPPPNLSPAVRHEITEGNPAAIEQPPIENLTPAQWAYMRLAQAIVAFEQKLDAEHEVGFHLVQFGGGQVFHAENLGYWAPDLLIFFGKNGLGDPIQLIQHVTQLNVLLVAAKKAEAEGAPRRIGFDILQDARKVAEGKTASAEPIS